jgi:hypothetical protein
MLNSNVDSGGIRRVNVEGVESRTPEEGVERIIRKSLQ